jgi:dipeptidyl aminopeptidase/acylaminoacyl peptidase
MPRRPTPTDLARLRVPTDLRLSPDGRQVCFVVKEAAPGLDGYRTALWLAPADGSEAPRQLTLGARRDVAPRWSPDGRWLAFLSDRGHVLRAGGAPRDAADLRRGSAEPTGLKDASGRDITRGAMQVWLLPTSGGEARQLTDLPEDVGELVWSPDGGWLCVVSGAMSARPNEQQHRAGDPPRRDARLIDELDYQLNGVGFTYETPPRLWIVDAATGETRRLTSGSRGDEQPAWSPDGRHIAFASNRGPGADLVWRSDLYVIPAAGGRAIRVTAGGERTPRVTGGGERTFRHPVWSPDGRLIAAIGHRFEARGPTRDDVWVFPPEAGAEGRNLTAQSDLFVDAMLNSDLHGFGETGPHWTPDGEAILFEAPIEGAFELWRTRLRDGRVERLTSGRHLLRRSHAAALGDSVRIAAIRGTSTEPLDVVSFEIPPMAHADAAPVTDGAMRRLSSLMADAWRGIQTVAPEERWHEVHGRRIQGWLYEAPRRRGRPAPLVVEIHGGPATLYGWSLMWEWQVIVAAGISVYACNPRGSTGYGQAFAAANHRDWGEGPMADIEAGVDAILADGRADRARLGVTGGSYGGYLTAWMIGHTDRYAAAVACRGVYDMTSEMLSGDIGGPNFGRYEFGVQPWEDRELYQRVSPITYATAIRTPLLIQHAEQDLRCPITQAEELFAVLRSLRRPVRLMRTPGESHELTRSGAPFRRIENLEHIRDWFVHYLVRGERELPRR